MYKPEINRTKSVTEHKITTRLLQNVQKLNSNNKKKKKTLTFSYSAGYMFSVCN